MQAVFGEQQLRQEGVSGAPTRDRMRGSRRLRDRFAGAAGELIAHMLDHLSPARHHLERVGYILAELAQSAAATRAGRRHGIDDPLAWQMIGKTTARLLRRSKRCTLIFSVAALRRQVIMPHSADRLRSSRMLRHPPVDAFQQVAELCRRDRHHAVCRRRPDETPTLQPLRVKAHALTVVPQSFEKTAAPAAEHEQMPPCDRA